jgi:DNA-binding beta-propeller fold protein YncE
MRDHNRIWGVETIVSIALLFTFAAVLSPATAETAGNPSGYKVVRTISLPGEEALEHLTMDSGARRLYIARDTHVAVLNADTGAVEGDIPNTQGVHEVALAPEFGRGFTSNTRANTVTIFDLKSLKPLSTLKIANEPDSIVYDDVNKLVLVSHGRGRLLTVIRAADGSIAGTIPVADEPEHVVADDRGRVYVNLADPSQIAVVDSVQRSEWKRISLADCVEPSALAMDVRGRRVFAGCRNEKVVIVDPEAGKVVGRIPVGGRVEGMALAFDPDRQFVFAAHARGTLTIIHQDTPDRYTVVDTVATRPNARRMAFDPKTHQIYLLAADPVTGADKSKVKSGSGVLLVLGRG